ncbi:MAG: hypothetical protein ACLGXA_16755 [Acidobacteriota bacterium]
MARDTVRVLIAATLGLATAPAWSQAPANATGAFDQYVTTVEARLAQQHQAGGLAGEAATPEGRQRLRQGELVIEELKTPEVPGAMLHDWRGSAFAPGARAAGFERTLRDFDGYARVFAPEVLQARTLTANGDHIRGWMRVRQKHVITVVLDTTYDVRFSRLDAHEAWSTSRSTRIQEIADPGTSHEHALSPQQEHGFLWRMNTWWTWQERDGGLYMQVESVSLTRGIPPGLGWIVRPFVESVPRESLAFTLKAARSQWAGAGKQGLKGSR